MKKKSVLRFNYSKENCYIDLLVYIIRTIFRDILHESNKLYAIFLQIINSPCSICSYYILQSPTKIRQNLHSFHIYAPHPILHPPSLYISRFTLSAIHKKKKYQTATNNVIEHQLSLGDATICERVRVRRNYPSLCIKSVLYA